MPGAVRERSVGGARMAPPSGPARRAPRPHRLAARLTLASLPPRRSPDRGLAALARPPALRLLLPDAAQVDDHLDRLLHVLNRHPLDARVVVVAAGEQVRRR